MEGMGERRIGRRRQIRSIPMAWCRDPRNPDPYLAERTPDGTIVELSVSGAGLVAITHPYLAVGSTVLIATVGTVGAVIVRRFELDVYPGETYYGMEYGEPNSALAQALQRASKLDAEAPALYLPRD